MMLPEGQPRRILYQLEIITKPLLIQNNHQTSNLNFVFFPTEIQNIYHINTQRVLNDPWTCTYSNWGGGQNSSNSKQFNDISLSSIIITQPLHWQRWLVGKITYTISFETTPPCFFFLLTSAGEVSCETRLQGRPFQQNKATFFNKINYFDN